MLAVYIAIIVLIPIIAQMIRCLVESGVKNEGFVSVIPGVFSLNYSENRGVAFGLFQNGTLIFAITTSIVIIIASIFLVKNYKKSKLLSVALVLIIGGGLGNLFERIYLGYVVDYLSLSFFSPICNFADYCITAGTICLIVYLLFFSDMMKNDKKDEKKDDKQNDEADEKKDDKKDEKIDEKNDEKDEKIDEKSDKKKESDEQA